MPVRRPPARLVGAMLLIGSGASSLVHRSVWEVARHGPPRLAEFGLGLLSFLLASAGMLLLIHGRKVFESPSTGRSASADSLEGDLESRLLGPITPAGRAFDTHRGVRRMKELHAIGPSTPAAVRGAMSGPAGRFDPLSDARHRRD